MVGSRSLLALTLLSLLTTGCANTKFHSAGGPVKWDTELARPTDPQVVPNSIYFEVYSPRLNIAGDEKFKAAMQETFKPAEYPRVESSREAEYIVYISENEYQKTSNLFELPLGLSSVLIDYYSEDGWLSGWSSLPLLGADEFHVFVLEVEARQRTSQEFLSSIESSPDTGFVRRSVLGPILGIPDIETRLRNQIYDLKTNLVSSQRYAMIVVKQNKLKTDNMAFEKAKKKLAEELPGLIRGFKKASL
jgi:hypothetical protein